MRPPGSDRRGTRPASSARTAANGRAEWVDFAALTTLMAACALGGGSSFADVLSLLYVRPVAVAVLMVFALTPARVAWSAVRAPLLMLGALAAIMAAQLVPLPPALWTALPGRAAYAALAADVGMAKLWRPLSLTPDLTMNSLAALVVPAAVLVGFAKLDVRRRQQLVLVLVALCLASAALGVAQLAAGGESALYLYQRTYPGFPVGFLSNRNHQAALLAIVFPALRVWTLMPSANRLAARRRLWLALALGVVTLPVILATGSRAGILLSAASLVFTLLAFPGLRGPADERTNVRHVRLIRIGVLAAAVLLIVLSYVLGRAASIDRLSTGPAIGDDQRFQFAPVVVRIVRATFPAGTGFGSFDPVFRRYEPDAILIDSYFNHAHNELLELIMTAGLPGLVLLLAFVGWWLVRVVPSIRREGKTAGNPYVLLGAIIVAVMFGSSLVDYPLRTPIISAVFALACGWLATSREGARR